MDREAYRQHAEVEGEHWWFVARRQMVADVMRGLDLGAGARIVELGSGTGGNLRMLRGFGEVVAVEPDPRARAVSETRARDVQHVARIEDLTGGHAFDAALALDVLEHIDDAPGALRKLGGWMAPKAPLVVTVPAHRWLFGRHDVQLHHVRRYTTSTLREHLAAGGFEVASVRPMFAPLLPVAVALRAVEAVSDRIRPSRPALRGMAVPPWPLNAALARLFALERFAAPGQIPFGLSLLAVARLSERT